MQSVTPALSSRPVVISTGPMVRVSGLSSDELDEITRALTTPNPAIAQIRRFSGFVPRDVPRHLYGYVIDGNDILIAPGFAARARQFLIQRGRDVRVHFDQAKPFGTPMLYHGEDRDYQGSVVEEGGARRQGYFVAPCGSGKTDMGVRLIARWGMPSLVIVHTRELMRQWCDRIRDRLHIEAVTYGGGKKKPITGAEQVIIATVQMLRRSPGLMTQLAVCRKLVLIDECHHTPAATFTDVLAKLNPWVRYGFTATEHRTDGLSMMLSWWIGPKLAEIPREMLEAAGHIVRPKLCVKVTGYIDTYNPDEPGDYTRLMARICDDPARLEQICRAISVWHEQGRVHIVLTGSIAYGQAICDMLNSKYPNVRAVECNGRLPRVEREDALESIRHHSANVIIATSLADEGLDLPELSDLWTVTPTRSEAKTEQRVGRICRPAPGKPVPRVHDFVDVGVAREVIDRETGGTVMQRIFVNQFKNRFYRCYRRIADCDKNEVMRVLDGGR